MAVQDWKSGYKVYTKMVNFQYWKGELEVFKDDEIPEDEKTESTLHIWQSGDKIVFMIPNGHKISYDKESNCHSITKE